MDRLAEGQPAAVVRRRLHVTGTVQGVGFRPFCYCEAVKRGLTGYVENGVEGVMVEVEGDPAAVQDFIRVLREQPPLLARIHHLEVVELPPVVETSFTIRESTGEGVRQVLIPPDIGTCQDCARELADPSHRMWRYPFTNCTQCGPRYTIVREIPYDRHHTAMAGFPLCPDCEREYHDPANRRYHAQPVACPRCGPVAWHVGPSAEDGHQQGDNGNTWLERCWHDLDQGKVVAIKGLGGYHLAVDALNIEAIRLLRYRKKRPHQPFALMVGSLDGVREICCLGEAEKQILLSPQAPIVLMERREGGCPAGISPEGWQECLAEIAPGVHKLGVMLPYTPLHHLLFTGRPQVLVMTSGNRSGLPLAKSEEEAVATLSGVADSFVHHNRPIIHRIDDSVVDVRRGSIYFFRRARGFVPVPVEGPTTVDGLIGLGGELKNTFAVGRGASIFLGPHMGELAALEVQKNYLDALGHLLRLLGVEPQGIVYDLHPGYATTSIASRFNRQGLPVLGVQHHHAHMMAVAGEHRLTGKCLGIVLDGTGYGPDGRVWGMELLWGDATGFSRVGHLKASPLPGGDQAIRYPWRAALGMVAHHLGDQGIARAARYLGHHKDWEALGRMLSGGWPFVMGGTCGRLFDAVAALLGLVKEATYDGHPAILMENIMDKSRPYPPYHYRVQWHADRHLFEADPGPVLAGVLQDLEDGSQPGWISGRLHETVCWIMVDLVKGFFGVTGQKYPVVLGGGAFQNMYLVDRLQQMLEEAGWQVWLPTLMPPNDGALAAGQLVVAGAVARRDKGKELFPAASPAYVEPSPEHPFGIYLYESGGGGEQQCV